MDKPVKLYIVVPCYNEEAVLNETSRQMLELMRDMRARGLVSSQSRICFVDDGSKDDTWRIIDRLTKEHSEIAGIKLACNAGHQNALFGGLMTIRHDCDCAISIDADLQDDIRVIPEMVQNFIDGCDVVYGVRNRRDTDTFFKRTTAVAFYKLMHIMGVKIVFNHADYRLMSARALEALSQFPERNLFLRGMAPLVGYKSSCVYYDRNERFAGESKYPLKKMLSFAFDGITSFSVTPIRLISSLGALVCIIAVIMAIYTLVEKFCGNTDAGWASMMMSIWFIGGVQLLSVGLIGEYVGKLYKEVKRRPRFIIEAYVNNKEDDQNV
ncbi:MAG: glycosyltransferase family 2 protein [Clostridiales bacterium]|nr:glycosyltransferase family 2 protein [Clostridiales bacterium]